MRGIFESGWMNPHHRERNRVLTLFLSMVLTLVILVLCYVWVDRAVADWTYTHVRFSSVGVLLDGVIASVDVYKALAPWLVIVCVLSRFITVQIRMAVLGMSGSLLCTCEAIGQLKILFGRYWPATFYEGNMSWVQDQAYGFAWLQWGRGMQSFPSSHTGGIVACMTVLYWFFPRLRVFAIAHMGMVALGLILMTYHFVSDVIAGAFIGAVLGYCFAVSLQVFLEKTTMSVSQP